MVQYHTSTMHTVVNFIGADGLAKQGVLRVAAVLKKDLCSLLVNCSAIFRFRKVTSDSHNMGLFFLIYRQGLIIATLAVVI